MKVRVTALLLTLVLSIITSYKAFNSRLCQRQVMNLLSMRFNNTRAQRTNTLGELLRDGNFELIDCKCFGQFLFKWTSKPVATSSRILYFKIDYHKSFIWSADQADNTWYAVSYSSIRSYIER